jgi:hypothetical protein
VLLQLGHKTTDLDRYIYLVNLLDHDETLFYRTVMSDPARFLPDVSGSLRFQPWFRYLRCCRSYSSPGSAELRPQLTLMFFLHFAGAV